MKPHRESLVRASRRKYVPAALVVMLGTASAACAHTSAPETCRMTRYWQMQPDGNIVYRAMLTGPDDRFQEIHVAVAPGDQRYADELARIAATGGELTPDAPLTVAEDIACPAQ